MYVETHITSLSPSLHRDAQPPAPRSKHPPKPGSLLLFESPGTLDTTTVLVTLGESQTFPPSQPVSREREAELSSHGPEGKSAPFLSTVSQYDGGVPFLAPWAIVPGHRSQVFQEFRFQKETVGLSPVQLLRTSYPVTRTSLIDSSATL